MTFTLDFDDPDLSVITDINEWAYFKQIRRFYSWTFFLPVGNNESLKVLSHADQLQSNLESDMMKEGTRDIYIERGEVVNIPFAFRGNKPEEIPQKQPHEGDIVDTKSEGVVSGQAGPAEFSTQPS
eukprot:SAG31_NODE_2697_length_5227_cov_1.318643_4_plen_126_part_00